LISEPLEIPDRPWTSLPMDFITGLPSTNGYTCIFVVLDRFTKIGIFILFPNVPSSEHTAKAFMTHIFRLHGLPNEILSDRGTQFTSKFWTSTQIMVTTLTSHQLYQVLLMFFMLKNLQQT